MGLFDYQRLIVGYHGTDAETVQKILRGETIIEYSKNRHDWLGRGIYFWEHGPQRAYDWAVWRSKHGGAGAKITKPAVIGAFINLGNCFDLLDTRNTAMLNEIFPLYKESCNKENYEIPKNEKSHPNDLDHTKRHLDCAVINWVLQMKEKDGVEYHSVRCIFSEGQPAFPGSSIMDKSHIQIAVRAPAAVLGYFKPNVDFTGKE